MLQKIHLSYDLEQFIKCDYPETSTCIKHQVKELKDIHDEFNGFPDSYTLNNTGINQRWWNRGEIDFDVIGEQLKMDVKTISSIRQLPGNVIPWHRDTFYQIKKNFPEDDRNPVRANIYLEDWKIGHFIQYGDSISTHWQAGDGFIWNSEVLHLGANAGMEPKHTLQVSGFLK